MHWCVGTPGHHQNPKHNELSASLNSLIALQSPLHPVSTQALGVCSAPARDNVQEYLGITGNPKFNELSAKLAFGEGSGVIRERRNATVQALSGTGSLRVSAITHLLSASPLHGNPGACIMQ